MNWGKGIFIAFVLFAGFILSIVFKMTHQKVDLVSPDYYKDEIAFETQMHKQNNANAQYFNIEQDTVNHSLIIHTTDIDSTLEMSFYRPSNKDLDFVLHSSKSERQVVDTKKMAKGLWKIDFKWQKDGEHLLRKQQMYIQ